jgi:hypothetical protein
MKTRIPAYDDKPVLSPDEIEAVELLGLQEFFLLTFALPLRLGTMDVN